MKKLMLVCFMLFYCAETFSIATVNSPRINSLYALPGKLNAMTLQEFLNITPKRYLELTGKKMTFKQKLSLFILKSKLKKQLTDDKPVTHKTDLGLLSLIFGGAAFLLAIIPFAGVVSIPLAIAAIILGILGLGRKKGDTKSIIGLVLGSVFILLIGILIATFASGGWWH